MDSEKYELNAADTAEDIAAVTVEGAAEALEDAAEIAEAADGKVADAETADGKDADSADGDAETEAPAKTAEEIAAEENEAACDEALSSEKFCLTFMLRFKDLMKFNLRSQLLGLSNSLFWVVLVLSVAYLVVSWKELSTKKAALIIVLLVFLLWYVPIRAVRNAAKSALYLKTQSTPTEYHVCEEGFVICQEGMRGVLKYDKISRIKETGSTLYAYVFRNSAFVFPKDLTAEHYDELKAVLRSQCKAKQSWK